MIKSQKELRVTLDRLKEFEDIKKELFENMALDPDLKDIQLNAITYQISKFEEDVRNYELLKTQGRKVFTAESLLQLPELLIAARVCQGISQTELAKKINLLPQQVQRDEAEYYKSAAISKIAKVAKALGINFRPIRAHFSENVFL